MKFDFNTIQNFDKHIEQSIPNYDILSSSILRMSEFFVQEGKTIYDIGCSTGKLVYELQKKFPNKVIGIDKSSNLLPKEPCFVEADLNNSYDFKDACIVYSLFTLQFLRKENRQKILQDIYKGLCNGGALFLAEKTYAESSPIQDIFTFSYYDYKKSSFSEKDILDKERDLRTILRPNTHGEIMSMLNECGFKTELFYKYFMFNGYLCVK